jgi:tRNA G18 (ribose-2'-O)-methylase SpoU
MPVVRISGPDDPRVSAYRSVTDPDLIRARGLFVAEGRLVVERLIGDGRYAIQSLLLSEAARRALEPALGALQPSVPIYICEAPDFRGIAGYDVHRGCLALSVRPSPPVIDDVLAEARLVVVLEGVTNADNVGGVFRNAAAFGADAGRDATPRHNQAACRPRRPGGGTIPVERHRRRHGTQACN